VTHGETPKIVRNQDTLMEFIHDRQLRFLGHVIYQDGVEKLTLTGKIEGKQDRGRQWLKYIDQFGVTISKGEFILYDLRKEDWRSMIRQRSSRDTPW